MPPLLCYGPGLSKISNQGFFYFFLDHFIFTVNNQHMHNKIVTIWDELIRVSILLLQNMYNDNFIPLLVDHCYDITLSDAAYLYLYQPTAASKTDLTLQYVRGNDKVRKTLPLQSDLVSFLRESGEAVVLSEPANSCFSELLLTENMNSGTALHIGSESQQFFILILNSLHVCHYTQERFDFLNKLAALASVMFAFRIKRQ
jgi:hypothetical protein